MSNGNLHTIPSHTWFTHGPNRSKSPSNPSLPLFSPINPNSTSSSTSSIPSPPLALHEAGSKVSVSEWSADTGLAGVNLLVLGGRRVGGAASSGSTNRQTVPGESVRAKRALSMSESGKARSNELLTHRGGRLVRYGRCNRGVFDLGSR
jgi:hypothetical protein